VSVQIMRGNALALPLADDSVDLVVTSPPYFGLRSYQDGGTHYSGQIGDEPTPAEFVDALIAATAEMVRVVKPSGSIWVNLGDKYASTTAGANGNGSGASTLGHHKGGGGPHSAKLTASSAARRISSNVPQKSLIGIPWRYALRCIDDLGLILRAEVIWSKPNGLPESVTDRVRRSHEQWFHFTLSPRYYSAVDEIREDYSPNKPWGSRRVSTTYDDPAIAGTGKHAGISSSGVDFHAENPLGKLPGSVWVIPTEPLHVPDHLGVDHFAAFPTEWPRRIIQGWSPRGICTVCGEGRRPVVVKPSPLGHVPDSSVDRLNLGGQRKRGATSTTALSGSARMKWEAANPPTLVGEACACPEPTAPTRPGTVLDPFGGTGTTALVADTLGRHGISLDMSADYCRLATWRTSDPKQRAKAARREYTPPREQADGQESLFPDLEALVKVRGNAGSSLVGIGRQTCPCGYRSQNARSSACEMCGEVRSA
jgi:DNA modification methylase